MRIAWWVPGRWANSVICRGGVVVSADQLPFPTDDHMHDPYAHEIGERLRASYAAQPVYDSAHKLRVSRAVLAGANDSAVAGHRGVRPRWWWGAAAAAVLMVVVMRPWRPEAAQQQADSAMARTAPPEVISGRTREERGGTVRFEFTLPGTAREVALVGDFNAWNAEATPMQRDAAGTTWSTRIALEPGRHEYAFVVDGQRWVIDPLAPQVPDAGFGPTNAVVIDGGAQP
ncbi:isoamylase early set domain-containing protein [Gemmatimonas sp.]